jgi:hypothetical protein
VLAELAVRRVLHGQLPAPEYPDGAARTGTEGLVEPGAAGPDPAVLRDLVDGSRSLCSDALRAIYTL